MSLTHDPFQHLRLFEDAVTRLVSEPRGSRPWSPAVDILENENELVLKADLPAIQPEEIDVQVENQTLTLKGQRKFEQTNDKTGYHRIERSFGKLRPDIYRAHDGRYRAGERRLRPRRVDRPVAEEGSR